jgi:predicted regulator of Ras-like GTPase activity (Roadblock/LC7/MglB family)
MSLENLLAELKSVKGYKAAGIMTFTGEMLASDTADSSIDLDVVGATFNDIFRGAHEASGKVGLQSAKETIIQTPNGTIVMFCSGVDSPVHFHVISVLDADGNQALAKLSMEKLMPKIMTELQ